MIFYFSGTGNSLWVAKHLQAAFQDSVCNIAQATIKNNYTFSIAQNEKIGFVFPIHAWGIPPIVAEFIRNVQFSGYQKQLCYIVFTCGDNCGLADKQILRLLRAKGMSCSHIYSIQMPNTYICKPNFRLDSKKTEERKIRQATGDIPRIIEAIENNTPIKLYQGGSFKWLKSKIIHPQFIKHSLSSRPFYTTDKCNACGLCAKRCPVGNIVLINNKPGWKNDCTQCLACLYFCPNQAIEYGKSTLNKGRYTRFVYMKETDMPGPLILS